MEQKSRRVKIGFSIPNFDTAGSGKALLKVATNLDKTKFEPHIICFHNRGEFFKAVKKSEIPIHIIQYTHPMKPYYLGLWNALKTSFLLRKLNLDLIHSFHYAADYSEALSARLANIKWVYTKKNMNWGGASKNGWLVRSYLANRIIIQNTDMKKIFFPKSKKTDLIPRGVDTIEFKPDIKTNLKSDLKLLDFRILVCVANLVPVKGLEILIESFGAIHKDFEDWKILIVGEDGNAYGRSLKEMVTDMKLTHKILFQGKQANIREYLAIAEAFALPTLDSGRKEGSPVSVLEAMSCELNVLGSNISGIRDQLKDFPENLVTPGEVREWSFKLSKVFSNTKQENKELGRLFRILVLNKYDISREVELSEQVYLKTIL